MFNFLKVLIVIFEISKFAGFVNMAPSPNTIISVHVDTYIQKCAKNMFFFKSNILRHLYFIFWVFAHIAMSHHPLKIESFKIILFLDSFDFLANFSNFETKEFKSLDKQYCWIYALSSCFLQSNADVKTRNCRCTCIATYIQYTLQIILFLFTKWMV